MKYLVTLMIFSSCIALADEGFVEGTIVAAKQDNYYQPEIRGNLAKALYENMTEVEGYISFSPGGTTCIKKTKTFICLYTRQLPAEHQYSCSFKLDSKGVVTSGASEEKEYSHRCRDQSK